MVYYRVDEEGENNITNYYTNLLDNSGFTRTFFLGPDYKLALQREKMLCNSLNAKVSEDTLYWENGSAEIPAPSIKDIPIDYSVNLTNENNTNFNSGNKLNISIAFAFLLFGISSIVLGGLVAGPVGLSISNLLHVDPVWDDSLFLVNEDLIYLDNYVISQSNLTFYLENPVEGVWIENSILYVDKSVLKNKEAITLVADDGISKSYKHILVS